MRKIDIALNLLNIMIMKQIILLVKKDYKLDISKVYIQITDEFFDNF